MLALGSVAAAANVTTTEAPSPPDAILAKTVSVSPLVTVKPIFDQPEGVLGVEEESLPKTTNNKFPATMLAGRLTV
jgi:hypothetical protein